MLTKQEEKEGLMALMPELIKIDFALEIDERELVGITGTGDGAKFFKLKTLLEGIDLTSEKIKYSLSQGIEFTYSGNYLESFNQLNKLNAHEVLIYYYLENAIFRLLTAWDNLAHLFNEFYDVGVPKDKIYSRKFFTRTLLSNSEYTNISSAFKIKDYIEESEDTSPSSKWKGNHDFLRTYRNKFTHNNAPDNFSLSNFDLNLKYPPNFILKRSVEDFNIFYSFYNDTRRKIYEWIISSDFDFLK